MRSSARRYRACPFANSSRPSASASRRFFAFAQAIGFRGFKEFKISLAEQTPTFQDYFVAAPSEGKSTVQNLVERLLLTERDAIETTLHMLDYARLDEAAQLVARAQRICLFGVSTSFDICRDMQRRLSRLGISAWASNEFHDAVVQLARFRAEDLLICVSQSGATNEVLDVAKQGQQFGVPLLAITAFPSSPVGRLARVVLPTYAPEITGNRLGHGNAHCAICRRRCAVSWLSPATWAITFPL